MRYIVLLMALLSATGAFAKGPRKKAAVAAASLTGDPVADALVVSLYGVDGHWGSDTTDPLDDPQVIWWRTWLGYYLYDTLQADGLASPLPADVSGGWVMFGDVSGAWYGLTYAGLGGYGAFPPGAWVVYGGRRVDNTYDGDALNAIGLGIAYALLGPDLIDGTGDEPTFHTNEAAARATLTNGLLAWTATHGFPHNPPGGPVRIR